MESIRKWFYKPKRDDPSLLAQFFYADEALNLVAAELDSFDGRKDPERCTALVNHLRQCQDKVLTICNRIMDDVIPAERANRDFRVKFPDDVMQENLAGQLWFGAECLAAGSSIMNREGESSAMRPLAKALTKALENVRNLLREQCLRGNAGNNPLKPNITSGMNEVFGERLQEALKIFDRLFAEFEFSYVSAMVPVKSTKEYELQQLVVVLFSETLQRALKMNLLTQEMVDDYDPALMFTIPRLAIVSGLLIFPDGPLCLDRTPADMSEMFRPFRNLLQKIRELLWTLNKKELFTLEKLLCSSEEPGDFHAQSQQINICDVTELVATSHATSSYPTVPDLDDFVTRFYIDYPSCKQLVTDFYATATSRNMEDEETQNIVSNEISENTKTIKFHGNASCAKTENGNVSNILHNEVSSWESTEESEDETEWIGEASECETVVTDNYETEETGSFIESDSKTLSSLPEDILSQKSDLRESCSLAHPPGLKESMIFGEHINIDDELESPSSSPCASYLSVQGQNSVFESHNHLPCSDTVTVPTPTGSGFLLANQVGHESMLASMERITSSTTPDISPVTGGSLPDGDSHEALSVATATLSTLLLSSPNLSPCEGYEGTEVEEDSGVGTVISCSDAGSLSDRSPDTATVFTNVHKSEVIRQNVKSVHFPNNETEILPTVPTSQKRWQVEITPCSCTSKLSSSCKHKKCAKPLENCSDAKISNVNGMFLSSELCTNSDDGKYSMLTERIGCGGVLSEDSENIVVSQSSVEMENHFGNRTPCEKCVLNSECERDSYFTSGDRTRPEIILIADTSQKNDVLNSNSIQNSSQKMNVNRFSDAAECSNAAVYTQNVPQDSVLPGEIFRHSTESPELDGATSNLNSCHNVYKSHEESTISNILVRKEEKSEKKRREWVDKTNYDYCIRCRSNDFSEVSSPTPDHVLNYASNWEQLQKPEISNLSSETENAVSCMRHSNTASSFQVQQGLLAVSSQNDRNLDAPLASSFSSTSSSCQSSVTVSSDSCSMSSDTSSFNSECQDDEEIALAMQAAEIANRNEVRAKFRSSEDLVHRLFVCIAGVADQLQTNFAGDLRHILKCVFLMSATSIANTEDVMEENPAMTGTIEVEALSPSEGGDSDISHSVENAEEALSSGWESPGSPAEVESPPPWIPDDMAPRCMSCEAVFTVVRRRHHCRNCGKVFCARCSSNSVPLPRYGHVKPVRVCNRCFLYQVTPFTLEELATRS